MLANSFNEFNKHRFVIISFVAFLSIYSISCHNVIDNNKGELKFLEYTHDFGSVPYRSTAEFKFKFTNVGKVPLVIYSTNTSCRCTNIVWPKKPIKPGEQGQITVTYDSAFSGMFFKRIRVYFNGKGSPVIISIKGKVGYPNS